jgi:hypothetical protein
LHIIGSYKLLTELITQHIDDLKKANFRIVSFPTRLMGLSRIHTLAGEFSERKFYTPDEFEESERGFWEEMFEGVPADVRKVLNANLEAVQMSVLLGTLLGTFELDNGKLGLCNPVMVVALPKFLSYRIPFLRGSDPPYAK